MTLARTWNPRSMRSDDLGAAMLDAVNAAAADALNPLIDLEQYAPIILNPTRCLENDIDRILALNGITRAKSLSSEQARRLAVIAQALRSWRGSFRSLRSVIGALTGGPVILRPWLGQRIIISESSWDFIVLPIEEYRDVTQAFLLGQGPDSAYDAARVEDHVNRLARTILDGTEYVPCYALTAWRDGFAGWGALGGVELITSSVDNEYESVDMGPGVNPLMTSHRITSPTSTDSLTPRQWATVWFKTQGADDASTWYFMLSSDNTPIPTAYCVIISTGNHELSIARTDAGIDTIFGTKRINIPDGDSGDWHRLDFLIVRESGRVALRAYVDNDPSGWFYDMSMATPGGSSLEVLVTNANFPAGRLRIAAITATQ